MGSRAGGALPGALCQGFGSSGLPLGGSGCTYFTCRSGSSGGCWHPAARAAGCNVLPLRCPVAQPHTCSRLNTHAGFRLFSRECLPFNPFFSWMFLPPPGSRCPAAAAWGSSDDASSRTQGEPPRPLAAAEQAARCLLRSQAPYPRNAAIWATIYFSDYAYWRQTAHKCFF